MMPLWTTASLSVACGWALVSFGLPWVAQRVWPMPMAPESGACGQLRSRLRELALGAAALEPAVLERGDAGGIVAAVFKPLQRLDDLRRDRRLADDSDDAAHGSADLLHAMRVNATLDRVAYTRRCHSALESTCVTDCDSVARSFLLAPASARFSPECDRPSPP